MRISDWSSDVCSSDLRFRVAAGAKFQLDARLDVTAFIRAAVILAIGEPVTRGARIDEEQRLLVLVVGIERQAPALGRAESDFDFARQDRHGDRDRKSTRLNSSH